MRSDAALITETLCIGTGMTEAAFLLSYPKPQQVEIGRDHLWRWKDRGIGPIPMAHLGEWPHSNKDK